MSDWYLVRDNGRQQRIAVATSGTVTWIFMDGNVWTIDAAAPERSRASAGRDSGVMSPMPATVIAISAAVGAPVTEGDTLIVLEAMKMELPIRAPRSGVVTAVHCAMGDLVQPGVNLVEIG